MSAAAELFWKASGHAVIMPGDQAARNALEEAAAKWREQGNYLSAGIAMTRAIYAAWGTEGGVKACAEAALADYDECLRTQPPESMVSLLALYKSRVELSHYIPVGEHRWAELGNRLLMLGELPCADGFLVKGFVINGDLDGEWVPSFPRDEVLPGGTLWQNGQVRVSFPSALYILVHLPDYTAASAIVRRFPDSFTTPGQRGWRAAILGFVQPGEAAERFAEAARAFSEDTHDPNRQTAWCSNNVDLWAKYFQARAYVAQIVREPLRAGELLRGAADTLTGTDSGWVNKHVSRFRILVQTLSQLVGGGHGLTPHEAREHLLKEHRWTGQHDDDEVSLRFLNMVGESFEGFRENPARELTSGHLRDALEALGRISLLGPGVSEAVSPALGEQALRVALGPDRTWVHRTLEGILDEAVFRKLILRLLQASPSPPAYGHIRHGPLEYGKDVVVLLEENGRRVLRLYQAKCGNITSKAWREARAELEEMFDVDLPDLQVRGQADEREGILICNGHVNTFAEPAMMGWFDKQARDRGRKYQFMHLDDVVNWIHHQRLYSDFRSACAELGLSTTSSALTETKRTKPRVAVAKRGAGSKSKATPKKK